MHGLLVREVVGSLGHCAAYQLQGVGSMQVLLAGVGKGSETKGPSLEFQIDVSSLPAKLLKQIA